MAYELMGMVDYVRQLSFGEDSLRMPWTQENRTYVSPAPEQGAIPSAEPEESLRSIDPTSDLETQRM